MFQSNVEIKITLSITHNEYNDGRRRNLYLCDLQEGRSDHPPWYSGSVTPTRTEIMHTGTSMHKHKGKRDVHKIKYVSSVLNIVNTWVDFENQTLSLVTEQPNTH